MKSNPEIRWQKYSNEPHTGHKECCKRLYFGRIVSTNCANSTEKCVEVTKTPLEVLIEALYSSTLSNSNPALYTSRSVVYVEKII